MGGFLHIRGRLKRFAKIGGEMINLPEIEGVLSEAWPSEEAIPEVAVLDMDKAGQDRPELVLFTSRPEIDLEQANAVLRRKGFTPLSRLGRIVCLKEMPLLGSGKIDIQSLKKGLYREA